MICRADFAMYDFVMHDFSVYTGITDHVWFQILMYSGRV